jgi:hypothetical protein
MEQVVSTVRSSQHQATIESDSVAPEGEEPAVAGPGPVSGPEKATGSVTADVTPGKTTDVTALVSPSVSAQVRMSMTSRVKSRVSVPVTTSVAAEVTPVVSCEMNADVMMQMKKGVTRGMTPGLTPWVDIRAQVSGPERVAESSPRRVAPERAVRLAGQATRYAAARARVMPPLEAEKAVARYVVEQAALGTYEERVRQRLAGIAPGRAGAALVRRVYGLARRGRSSEVAGAAEQAVSTGLRPKIARLVARVCVEVLEQMRGEFESRPNPEEG